MAFTHSRRAVSAAVALLGIASRSLPTPVSVNAQPLDVETGPWPTTTPEDADMDASLPDTLDAMIAEYPAVTGIVVIRDGAIVSEHYQGRFGQDDTLDIRTVNKSVSGTLTGSAIQRGELSSLDATIGELIPDRVPAGADPSVAEITVRSLLTMTSGLRGDYRTDYETLEASDDPVVTTLSEPIVAAQGDVYVYNSGGSHLLGLMLAAVTGQKVEDYADEVLFGPLGIERGSWRTYPQGDAIGGYGLRLTPRDMGRLGQLYLNGGTWNGQRLLPETYLDEATAYQSAGDETGGTPYGYQWWVTDASGYDAFFALGYGGQYIYVVPALDLICVVAVGYEDDLIELRSPRSIIETVIVPSART